MWTKDAVCLRSDSASEEIFQWNFQACDREWGVATPPHSLQIQLVLGWCLKGLEVGELQRSAAWTWKEGPSVVHWGMMKSVYLLVSGRVWSLDYSFSQAKYVNKSLLFGESVSYRSSNKRWSSKTQSPVYHLLTHAPPMNSHSTPLASLPRPLNTYISFPNCLEHPFTFFHSPLLNIKPGFQDILNFFFCLNNLLWFKTHRGMRYWTSK